jgi:hypothetical protein
VKHFRDKLLAHVTIGHDKSKEVRLGALWKLTQTALVAARSVRLIFYRADWDYLKESRTAERRGLELAKALLAS